MYAVLPLAVGETQKAAVKRRARHRDRTAVAVWLAGLAWLPWVLRGSSTWAIVRCCAWIATARFAGGTATHQGDQRSESQSQILSGPDWMTSVHARSSQFVRHAA